MAIALDLDPVWTLSTAVAHTSAAFSPVANSLIIVEGQIDGTTPPSPTISDSVGLTWTAVGTIQQGQPSTGGYVMAWWAFTASARTNMTVTIDWGRIESKAIKVTTYTGTASASAVISKAQSSSATNNLTTPSVSTTNDGCRIRGSAIDWNANGVPTSTDAAVAGYNDPGKISGVSVHKAANSSGVGTSVTLNFDAFGTAAADWGYKIYEIVPGASGPVTGSATLSAAGALAASAVVRVPGSASLSAGSTLAASAGSAVSGAASMSAGSTLAASAGSPWVRNARESSTGSTPTTTHSVAIPTCVVGDDLWASFTVNTGHGAVTDPSGWTRVFPTTVTDDGFMTLLIYRKTATATEVAGGNITVTVGTASRGNAGAASIVGSDPALAPEGVVSSVGTAGNTSWTQNVTTTADNALVLSILAVDSGSEIVTPSAPLVQRWNPQVTIPGGKANAGATVHMPKAGTATVTWTWTASLARKMWSAGVRSQSAAASGVASMSASSTLAASGLTIVPGGAALSASGAVGASSVVRVPGLASMSAGSTLVASTGGITTGVASMSASSTLAASALMVVPGGATLSASGALSAVGLLRVMGSAGLSASGALSTVGLGSAGLSASGALSAVGLSVSPIVGGSMSPTGRDVATATGGQGAAPAMTPTVRSGPTMTGG